MALPDTNILYYNARVRGMKSRLFTRAAIEEMLERDDLEHVIEVLLDSPYRKEMAEALTRHQGADAVEDAVSRNITGTRQTLIRMARGEFEHLARLFFLRHDLGAVKSLLRCRHHGLDGESAIRHLIPGPTLTPPLEKELLESGSMETLAAGLIAWNAELCSCLRPALRQYEETHDSSTLEEALDRGYFVDNARRLGASKDDNPQALRSQLQAEIDRINLRSLFQFFEVKGDRETLGKQLLPEGKLTISFVQRMADAGDPAKAMELLEITPYRTLIEELYPFMQTHRFAPIERFLEWLMLLQLRRMARRDVFGLAVMMEYGWLKYNEMLNLRLVARGLAGHLPTGRVREELHFAG